MNTEVTLTAPNTITANAPVQDGQVFAVTVRANLATREEADALVALFPKSANLRISEVTCYTDPNYFTVSTRISLSPVKGNERNETGIKRYHAIMARAAKVGLAVEWTTPYRNSVATREEAEALIG